MQKMNEYSLQKQHDRTEKEKKEAKRKQNQQQSKSQGRGHGHSHSRARLPSGTYSKEFAKVNYRDNDMNRLANEKKGTTSAYNYQDMGMEALN